MNIEEFRASLTAKRDLARRMTSEVVSGIDFAYWRTRAATFTEVLAEMALLEPAVGALADSPPDFVESNWNPSMCDNPHHAHHPSRTQGRITWDDDSPNTVVLP